MAPTVETDPDLTFATSDWGDTAVSRQSETSATASEVDTAGNAIRQLSRGEWVDHRYGELVEGRQSLERAAEVAAASAAAHAELRQAARDYERDAPTAAEVEAARRENDAAAAVLAAADDAHAASARDAKSAAQKRLRDLEQRRKAALEALAAADARIASRLRERLSLGGDSKKDGNRGRRGPDRAVPNPEKLASPSTPGARTPAAPGTPPAPAPATSLASTGPTPDQAAAVADLMAATQRPQQPVPLQFLQQPQQPPAPAPVAAPAPAPVASQRRNGKSDDDLINNAPAMVAAAATVPATAPPAPAAAAAPAPTPSGPTGTSQGGLVTDANVTGRSEGARTGLSAASTEQATGTAAQRPAETAARPMGGGAPGMMPMGGLGGGAPSQVKKDDEQVHRHATADGTVLHGDETVSEAVRGGTIAQRRDGGA